MGLNYQRASLEYRLSWGEILRFSPDAAHHWHHLNFLPFRLAKCQDECEACSGDPDAPWWYNTDFIGHSITLPLNGASLMNLEVADEIDPSRVIEVLEASQDRKSGLFKDIAPLHPVRKLGEVVLCGDCRNDQYFFAWAEELRQLYEIVLALEQQIELDKQRYDDRWSDLKQSPEKMRNLRFSDVPWPVRGSEKLSSPKSLRKLEVLRFLFSSCIVVNYAYRHKPSMSPREMVAEYKRTWNPKLFTRHRPWYSRRIPSFLTQQAAIVEGVTRIRRFLEEFEYESWGIYEQHEELAGYPRSHIARMSETASLQRSKWLGKDGKSIATRAALGIVLTTQTVMYVTFLQALQA